MSRAETAAAEAAWKIVVIDDDPTGSQTVHSCPLLLRWDVETLRQGLRHPSPLLFVLANTRALLPEAAAARNREIVASLAQAISGRVVRLRLRTRWDCVPVQVSRSGLWNPRPYNSTRPAATQWLSPRNGKNK